MGAYENSQQTGLVAVSRHRSRIRISNTIAVRSQKRNSPVAEEIMQSQRAYAAWPRMTNIGSQEGIGADYPLDAPAVNPPRQYFPKIMKARSRGNTLIKDPKAIS